MAHIDDVKKHMAKLDQVMVKPPKGSKERWKAFASSKGLSLQSYIISLVEADIANHNISDIE